MDNIGVKFNENIAVMNFLNCSIRVPMMYGGEAIASGCGSGKTTVIKDIIRQKFNEGILYSAATIEECNKMYDWIINNLIGTSINGVELTINDIVMFHYENNLVVNKSEVGDKLIVICTHYELSHECPEILLKKKFDQRIYMIPETGLRRSVTRSMQPGSKYILPRQYVLIDGLPKYYMRDNSNIILYGMETRIWLFDESCDLILNDGLKFKVRTEKNKYKSCVEYIKIKSYDISELIDIINENNKVLLITNEDFNLSDNKISDKICRKLEIQCNENLYIKYKDKEFSFISYYSDIRKIINKFKEYDSIVLYGNFEISNDTILKFNRSYECSASQIEIITYQLIKLIGLTRIRNHKGESIKIYFTDDWSDKYISKIDMYLCNSSPWINKYNINMLPESLIGSIQNKWKKDVISLIKYDDNIRIALLNKEKYSLFIELNVMNTISPRRCKQVREYIPLINYLRKLGIELTVTSKRIK